MEFFFKISIIISVLSGLCLLMQDYGSKGFLLCLITLVIGLLISLLSGIILRKGKVK